MSLTQEEINLFGKPLKAHEHTFGADFYMFGEDMYVVFLPKYETVTSNIVNYGYTFLEKHKVNLHHCIFIFDSFTDVSKEVRNWAADESKNRFTISDAIVLKDVSQKILSDYYVKQEHPNWPTKVFFDLAAAIQWSFDQK